MPDSLSGHFLFPSSPPALLHTCSITNLPHLCSRINTTSPLDLRHICLTNNN